MYDTVDEVLVEYILANESDGFPRQEQRREIWLGAKDLGKVGFYSAQRMTLVVYYNYV